MNAIVFVCQEGLLESQAAILAASLKMRAEKSKLVCAVFGQVEDRTISFMRYIGAEIRELLNDFDPPFYLGNKSLACNLDIRCDRKMFVDSDTICTGFKFDSVPECQLYTQVENPFPPLTEKNWHDASNFFEVDMFESEDLNRCLNDPLIVFDPSTGFEKTWLANLRRLHQAYHLGKIALKTRRKMSRLAYIAAIKSHGLDVFVEQPFSWDGDRDWWRRPSCICHAWEKDVPIWERHFNSMICQPDHVYGFRDGEELLLGLPNFLVLQDGMGYCERHQGKSPNDVKMGLSCYPFVRAMLYEILSEFPAIDQLDTWSMYRARYFENKDTKWFQKSVPDNMPYKQEVSLL
jgi:hypothetical protein